MASQPDTTIQSLGPCRIDSPLATRSDRGTFRFVRDEERMVLDLRVDEIERQHREEGAIRSFERGGAREKLYFDPTKIRAGIVTCGGLCPGLNSVVRAVVLQLWHNYGVKRIYGFRFGYQGFIAKYGHEPLELCPEAIDGIQDEGGTILGSSRGDQEPSEIVDCLERMDVRILFLLGGDGTMRGGLKLAAEIEKRGLKIGIVSIPKTIDNDILHLDESFGFQTAYSAAAEPISCAHTEAKDCPNGIGLVKLMGRHSGFIACQAALAMSDVNFVLIPEVPFRLEGPGGFFEALRRRLEHRHHAVIVVAEGAGQDLLDGETGKDASGNVKLKDIGLYLRDRITTHFAAEKFPCRVVYIDPSYIIRSVPPTPSDSVYCMQLGQYAVHAAMAGKTSMLVGRVNGHYVHIPIQVAISGRKCVDPTGSVWQSVLQATGQPERF